jgi:hypothetical protein
LTQETKASGRSNWVIGIIIGLAFVAIANAVFIYVAVKGADPVVPSYSTEPR